jgi:hypothetical protein
MITQTTNTDNSDPMRTNPLMSKIRHQYSIYSPPFLPFLTLILPDRPFSPNGHGMGMKRGENR